MMALRTFTPLRSPVTRPSNLWLGRTANSRVTLRVPSVSLTLLGWALGGRVTCARASPPETRSARVDSVMIRTRWRGPILAAVRAVRADASPAPITATRAPIPQRANAFDRADLLTLLPPAQLTPRFLARAVCPRGGCSHG